MLSLINQNEDIIVCIETLESLNSELKKLNSTTPKDTYTLYRIKEITDSIDRFAVLFEAFNKQRLMSATGYSGYGLV